MGLGSGCNEISPSLGKKGREIRHTVGGRLIIERSRDNIHFSCFFLAFFFFFGRFVCTFVVSRSASVCIFEIIDTLIRNARLFNIRMLSNSVNGLCSSAVVLVRGSFNRLDSKYPSFFMEPDLHI